MPSSISGILQNHPWLHTAVALALLTLAALFANFVVKAVLVRIVNHLLGKTSFGRDAELQRHGVIERLANVTPAVVVAAGIGLVPHLPAFLVTITRNVASAFIILTVTMAIGAAFNILDTLYRRRPEAQRKPIKGYIQVVKIAIYVIAALLITATLIDRSPLILLSGLGAMAAVLILVFQDTLLSLVAGIQISSTDMVRVGDWIEMPSLDVNGSVTEIALHTVSVQNFDKSITAIPIRKLVTEPFKNWRGMQEAGGRRIKRSIVLDQSSIRFLNRQEIDALAALSHLEKYLEWKQADLEGWNEKLGEKAGIAANTRRLTNVGTFRAYIDAYLHAHPRIHHDMSIMVRQLQPGPEGLPLEIYCFTDTTVWAEYEAIQADIFDHLLATAPEFGLSVFQQPTGRDLGAWAGTIAIAGKEPPAYSGQTTAIS